jgi:hypothetical protein
MNNTVNLVKDQTFPQSAIGTVRISTIKHAAGTVTDIDQ